MKNLSFLIILLLGIAGSMAGCGDREPATHTVSTTSTTEEVNAVPAPVPAESTVTTTVAH